MTNRELVLAYVKGFNDGKLEDVLSVFAPDAEIYGILSHGGLNTARPVWEQLIRCLCINLEVQDIVEQGDVMAVRYIERGTFVETFLDTAPTGKSYEVNAIEWYTFRNGLIHQRWGARDSASIWRQIGLPLN